MTKKTNQSANLHERIPPGYYEKAIKNNPFQRFWHQRRFKNVGDLITPIKGEILDVGCSDGTFTEVIYSRAKPTRIVGVDIIKSSIDYAQRKFKDNKTIEFRVADAQKLPFANKHFQAVFCLEALEHIPDAKKAILEMKRVLKPGGYLILLVPTDNHLFKLCWWVVLHTWGKHWRHTHIQSFNKDNALSDYVKKLGFEIVESRRFLVGMLEAVKAKRV